MPDIQRTQADLLNNIFQDGQAAGSITPQDVRDLFASLLPSFGLISITSSAATAIGSVGVYVKAAGGTGIPSGFSAHNFSSPVSNRLRYDGVVPVHAFVSGSIAISSTGANKTVAIKVAKNGVVLDESLIMEDLKQAGDILALSFVAGMSLVPTDFVEMFVANLTDTVSVTLEEMSFHVSAGIL